MTVLSSVRAAIRGKADQIPRWQRELALSLAAAMDEKPIAATASELRKMMALMLGEEAEQTDVRVVEAVDDIVARRAARRAAAS